MNMRPTIVCLCGSTRFYEAFQEANYIETMAGKIVLTVGHYPHTTVHGGKVGCTPHEKYKLDALHLAKIDMADEVLILNVGGYIGESTAREIAYAAMRGKKIRYLEAAQFSSPQERSNAESRGPVFVGPESDIGH